MMTPDNILLIEDQTFFWEKVKNSLKNLDVNLTIAQTVDEAMQHLKEEDIHLILLDLKLKERSGLEILRFIRRQNQLIPIIVISSQADMETRKICFQGGADDYLVKPIVPIELECRVKRALERTKEYPDNRSLISQTISLGNLTLDLQEKSLLVNGQPRQLRNKLFDLLLMFMQNPNKVINKDIFHRSVWKGELFDENSLNVHIHQLRKVIGNEKSSNPRILTIPKVGYKLHLIS